MTNQHDENLESLLRQFADETQARQMAEDIRYADRLFERNPAPLMPQETIMTVRWKALSELHYRKRRQWKIRRLCAAAVAAVVLTGLFILHFNTPADKTTPSPPQLAINNMPVGKDFNFSSDTSLAEIEQEITRLSEAVNAADADTGECSDSLFELGDSTDDCITVSPEFWKG